MSETITIKRGETFELAVRWGTTPIKFAAISNITQAAPVSITATSHGVPEGWPCAVVSVKGMRQINAKSDPPRKADHRQAIVVDANTVQFDIDASSYSAYTSGGYLRCMTPVDLADYTARMSIRDAAGGTEVVSLTTENGGITIDNVAKTITLLIDADDTTALTIDNGVYDLEMVKSGKVKRILSGTVVVDPDGDEVTTAP